MLHINKGRLHAFRKLSPFALPSFDCHAELRAQVLQESKTPWVEQRCMSVAWDWEFKGVTAEGINRELVSTLECSKLNREHNVQSLAVPETSILFMARRYVSEYEQLSQMPDGHQNEAVLAFRSTDTDASTADSESSYNALYGLPHLDGSSHFPLWVSAVMTLLLFALCSSYDFALLFARSYLIVLCCVLLNLYLAHEGGYRKVRGNELRPVGLHFVSGPDASHQQG